MHHKRVQPKQLRELLHKVHMPVAEVAASKRYCESAAANDLHLRKTNTQKDSKGVRLEHGEIGKSSMTRLKKLVQHELSPPIIW